MSVAYKNTTAAVLVKTGTGVLTSVILTSGADAATVTLYDNTAGSGAVILKLARTAVNESVVATGLNYAFGKGLYIALSGTTPSITVGYI